MDHIRWERAQGCGSDQVDSEREGARANEKEGGPKKAWI